MREELTYKLSANGMKYVYFEAAALYHIEEDEEALEIIKYKHHMLKDIMYTASQDEADHTKYIYSMLILHEAAKQYDDLEMMAKVTNSLNFKTLTKNESIFIETLTSKDFSFLRNQEMAVNLAMGAGINIRDAVTELEDLAFMVAD